MHEPRKRFALFGRHFSAPAERGTRTAQACSSLTSGGFFAEIQRGVALCGAREIAASAAGAAPYPRRWAKRKGHLRFPFLFELLPFPCLLVWRRLPTCDRFEKEYGRGFFLPYLSQPVRRCLPLQHTKNCAALLCRALRRVNRMCSSTLSVNCEYFTKDTLW